LATPGKRDSGLSLRSGFRQAWNVQYLAALALAFAGDTVRAKTLADDLDMRFREDILVQSTFCRA
jgi:hypothetical protein